MFDRLLHSSTKSFLILSRPNERNGIMGLSPELCNTATNAKQQVLIGKSIPGSRNRARELLLTKQMFKTLAHDLFFFQEAFGVPIEATSCKVLSGTSLFDLKDLAMFRRSLIIIGS